MALSRFDGQTEEECLGNKKRMISPPPLSFFSQLSPLPLPPPSSLIPQLETDICIPGPQLLSGLGRNYSDTGLPDNQGFRNN